MKSSTQPAPTIQGLELLRDFLKESRNTSVAYNVSMFRLSAAVARLGIYPQMLRLRADSGGVSVTWVGSERRFKPDDLDACMGAAAVSVEPVLREALCVRVPGGSGQEPSLTAQVALGSDR
ncbi:hypothetical protein [Dactylosporangium sp. CA-233914]|uniref:hypothetical protein n=1 Tax=Dactylosporangium sp. CA-233914 TaxID=3239934 RepID=UPI003D92D143